MSRKNRDTPGAFSEHGEDEHWHDTKVQDSVTAITGNNASGLPNDKSKEVLGMVAEREEFTLAIRQLTRVLMASDTRVRRVIQAAGESNCRTVALKANVASKVSAFNYNRSRIVLTGNNVDISYSNDPSPAVDGMNTTRIGYASSFFVREIITVRDVWVVATADCLIGVQEEFVS